MDAAGEAVDPIDPRLAGAKARDYWRRPKPMTFGAACRNGHKVYPSSLGQPSSMFANQPSAVCPPSFGDYENECLW